MVSHMFVIGKRIWFFWSFFFQAEDCIRYLYVTGVQTCALPISCSVAGLPRGGLASELELNPSKPGTSRMAAVGCFRITGRADVPPRRCPAVITPAGRPSVGPLRIWRGLPDDTVPARPGARRSAAPDRAATIAQLPS